MYWYLNVREILLIVSSVMEKMKKKIPCCECKKLFTPKHWQTVCCYKPECRKIYKADQRLRQIQSSKAWHKRHTKFKCRTRGCKNRVAKDGYYCPACIVRLSSVFADISQTEEGCNPSELTLWPPTPRMIY